MKGGSKGRDRITPQQDQKSHQLNSFSGRGRGDWPGSYRQNQSHRGRRDWNSHCSFNGKDPQQMINPRNNYISPPAAAAPLPDHSLYLATAKQIEYYFSADSLWKNIFLRRHMDEQVWVPVSLIAGFYPVEQLVKGIPDCIEYMLAAVTGSTIVETKGDMIRRHKNWMRWILTPRATPIPVYQGPSEANQMKDHLRGFSELDKVEDMRNSFFHLTCQLPIKMEARDKIIGIDAMKVLRDTLQLKYQPIRQRFDDAAKSYSEGILELIDKHPHVVDMPAFQRLLSDGQEMRFETLGTRIAQNKGKMPREEPDELRVKALHQELVQQAEDDYKSLLNKVLEYDQMIRFVDDFISIARNKHSRMC